ncbi:MAG: hypothetical protein HY568_00405, partial [Candidatus Latescibacteria bacterium]|nr:hypothetical protein [Candidatus Latescibacterota bacterium]
MNRPAIALAVCGLAYAAAVFAATARPSAGTWGLHSPGFLAPPLRLLVLAILAAGAGLLVLGAASGRRAPEDPRTTARSAAGRSSRARGLDGLSRRLRAVPPRWLRAVPPRWLAGVPPSIRLLAALVPCAGLLWTLRARTLLLGDGAVWLATVKAGEHRAYSEPLSAALWYGFANLLQLFRIPPDATAMAVVSILCGLLAVPLLTGVAREIEPTGRSRWIALALLLTLGVSQFYFGYIESYPAASLFVFLYLWLALRQAGAHSSGAPAR